METGVKDEEKQSSFCISLSVGAASDKETLRKV